jgi:hypothetical protein
MRGALLGIAVRRPLLFADRSNPYAKPTGLTLRTLALPFALTCLLLSGCHTRASDFALGDQVVLASPDLVEAPPPPRTPLNCPTRPIRARGKRSDHFNADLANRGKGALAVTVMRMRDTMTLRGTALILTHHPDFKAPMVAGVLTDSAGRGVLEAPQGIYYLRADLLGFRRDLAPVRLRTGAVDSVAIHLDETAVCIVGM